MRLELPPDYRELVRAASRLTLDMMDDPAYRDSAPWARLFPNAILTDPVAARAFDVRFRESIRDRKAAAADTTAASVEHTRLTLEQAVAWMVTLNDARLIVGTRIGLTKEAPITTFFGHPDVADHVTNWIAMSGLLELLVKALDPS